ncbi:hypothetical protein APICC_06790 [Apis cerana cerana]|uniref:Uncharacterized protein n=1 Tax=Apis cerana cerana TaxID=94128 RepID=A0A2A3EA65_APICC|nr:hypothetical protein APICC_06790 [Apis cerana cerana]
MYLQSLCIFLCLAALLLDRFLPLHVMFQTHVTSQVGSTTESGMAENAGSLVAMHFEVLGQRSKVLITTYIDSMRSTDLIGQYYTIAEHTQIIHPRSSLTRAERNINLSKMM